MSDNRTRLETLNQRAEQGIDYKLIKQNAR